MEKTNLIGATIDLVDRFAHLGSDELTNIKDDATSSYVRVKNVLFEGRIPKPDVKPKGSRQWFVWLSEKWYFRILVGLLFTLFVLPWARRKSHQYRMDSEDLLDAEKSDRRSGRSRVTRDGELLDRSRRRVYDDRYDDDEYDDDDDFDDDDDDDDYEEDDR